MKRVQWVDRTLVISPLSLGLCLSEKSFQAEMKRLAVPKGNRPAAVIAGAHATAHFFERDDGNLCAIVALGDVKGRTTAEIHALLVHEAVHVWQAVRKHIGEKEPSSEFEAYSVQNIAYSLMAAYDNTKEKGKKK